MVLKKVHRIPIVKGGAAIDSAPSPSVAGVITLLLSPNISDRLSGYSTVVTLDACGASDIFAIASSIIESNPSRSVDEATSAEGALLHFLAAHVAELETINIVAQLSRNWSDANIGDTPLWTALLEGTRREISVQRLSGALDAAEGSRVRYALLRALESPALRAAASETILHILREASPERAAERKGFAGQVLTTSRHLGTSEELQRVARTVFTSGYAERRAALMTTPSIQTTTTGESTEEQAVAQAQQLVRKLTQPEGSTLVPRLQPQDFQLLRKVSGLNLEVFRGVTDRIKSRAVSEPWARAAILDIVKAPHENEVTTSIRTSVLGALVNEARRIGKLSRELEKEVFAVSAEFPTPTESS